MDSSPVGRRGLAADAGSTLTAAAAKAPLFCCASHAMAAGCHGQRWALRGGHIWGYYPSLMAGGADRLVAELVTAAECAGEVECTDAVPRLLFLGGAAPELPRIAVTVFDNGYFSSVSRSIDRFELLGMGNRRICRRCDPLMGNGRGRCLLIRAGFYSR